MVSDAVTELRLALRAGDFLCIPVEGKRPPMDEWQKKVASDEEIKLWPKTWHLAGNTGIVARTCPGFDIDILDEDAAEAAEHLVREHFEEHGTVTTRIGLWPKRLIPLRTDEPFTKLVRSFRAPDGTKHKIEILCDGQQWVSNGIHPDTQVPYRWTHGEPGRDFARDDLPYVRREDIERFLDEAIELLEEEHGFTLVTGLADANGQAHDAGEPLASSSRVAAAVHVIPNDELEWDDWNRVGMAIWAATNGSAEGFEVFDEWSKKSTKYNAKATSKKWSGYVKSPPDRIGFGTLKHLADQADPAWEEALRGEPPEPAPGDPGPQPGPQLNPNKAPHVLSLIWHGEKPALETRAWCVQDLVPEVGTGIIAGQWGALKTFLALELANCIMTPRPFINSDFEIVRPGGVLLLALEGQSEVAIRFEAVLKEKGGNYLNGAPFAWTEVSPPLTDPKTADVIIATARAVEARLKQQFDLPLSLILLDSLVAGAGYRKEGQDNDTATTHSIMMTTATVSRALRCFSFVIDHYGKDTNVGTRGSSVKEGDADVIFACLGDRSEGGQMTNSRLALRKRRSGANGEEFRFRGRVVEMGLNPQTNKMETSLVIDWGVDQAAAKKPKTEDAWGRSKATNLLRRIIMRLLAECGEQIKPFADGPTVRALKFTLVEAEFYKTYATTGEGEKAKKHAKRMALQRAVENAGDRITTREIEGIDYIWLSQPGVGETLGPA